MERVETLLKKINDLFASGASPAELLLVTQMLQIQLQSVQNSTDTFGNIAINLPTSTVIKSYKEKVEKTPTPPIVEEKIVEVLQVNKDDIEAELEEIKKNAENLQKISVQNKPQIVFEEELPIANDKIEEIKKEVNDAVAASSSTSINDRLKQSKIDLGDTLTEAPLRDLKKAIGINDRFLFINELFRGDEAMYERSIKTINSFSILPEAEYWIQRELKIKIGWKDKSEVVLQFDQLIKRRFS
jgi:hypothetical protein